MGFQIGLIFGDGLRVVTRLVQLDCPLERLLLGVILCPSQAQAEQARQYAQNRFRHWRSLRAAETGAVHFIPPFGVRLIAVCRSTCSARKLQAFPSRFSPTAIAYHAYSFPNCDKPIGRHPLVAFMKAARPEYLKINGDGRAQAKMQPGIVAREKTRLTEHALGLFLSAVMHQDARPCRAAIGFGALELNLNPVRLSGEVVSQKRRRFVEVDDDDVHVTVIIEISEGATAAAMQGCDAGAGFRDQLFEYALSQVSENRTRSLVRVLGELLLNLRVN